MRNDHILVSVKPDRDYDIIGKPTTYEDAAAELKLLVEAGSDKYDKVALIALKSGVRKSRPIPSPAKTPSKKKSSE